jgi:hypothetical protein
VGRIVRTDSGAGRRTRILKSMALALRAAAADSPADDEVPEILAFLALCLRELNESFEETARAWERREYWLKADRFRSEWAWVPRILGRLEPALTARDWDRARACGMELASVLADRRLRVPDSKATPWRGAWDAWVQKH